jgi:hypothetical protein
MSIHIRTSDGGDWIAVYKDGQCVENGHSCDIRRGLQALGIEFTEMEMQLDEFGQMPDGSDPFPESL